jgi:hypothetical protein
MKSANTKRRREFLVLLLAILFFKGFPSYAASNLDLGNLFGLPENATTDELERSIEAANRYLHGVRVGHTLGDDAEDLARLIAFTGRCVQSIQGKQIQNLGALRSLLDSLYTQAITDGVATREMIPGIEQRSATRESLDQLQQEAKALEVQYLRQARNREEYLALLKDFTAAKRNRPSDLEHLRNLLFDGETLTYESRYERPAATLLVDLQSGTNPREYFYLLELFGPTLAQARSHLPAKVLSRLQLESDPVLKEIEREMGEVHGSTYIESTDSKFFEEQRKRRLTAMVRASKSIRRKSSPPSLIESGYEYACSVLRWFRIPVPH